MTLSQLRRSKGLEPGHVAKQLKISHRHLTRIEAGEGYLTDERIIILAKLYNVKMSEIVEAGESVGRIN
ncbi:helix-turn-helix transcriptional regulator [Clostridium estertheticum]|uniref:helix-turn-helix domain-containing protein n=1 Tax=Clostridium estertheticum TaxID=238834 RepID=UPI001CCE05EE|nr:helix-turn-helix transcriptional regulator [Clostridium estertheticum]MBZ9608675.1 helix-turn-helix transcriptional regulator [Clostridium estertheticum]